MSLSTLTLRAGAIGVLAAWLAAAPAPAAIVGSISGVVRNDQGVPQMGAVVLLMNAEGRSLRRVYTNGHGAFAIENLFPGVYGVRVDVPSFLPALREKISIEPGVRRFLDVQVANLFSSIQVVYPRGGQWSDMTDDWKWVLRTAAATRPVLRFAPQEQAASQPPSVLRRLSNAFGDTQGMLQVSAGDGGRVSGLGTETDLGTAFAVATSLFGNNSLLVSGNVGYGTTHGMPSAGFRTSYSRAMPYGTQPEVNFTVRQLFLPVQMGQALFGLPARPGAVLQTYTVGFQDRLTLGDQAKLEYGFLYDSISFLDRVHYASPFGKLTEKVSDSTQVVLSWANGVPRPDNSMADEGALGKNLSSLGLYPRLSLRDGEPALERGQHMEVAVQRKAGAGTVEVAAYHDSFSNAALTAMVPAGMYNNGDVLPDLFAATSTLNVGSYGTTGYRASYSRPVNEHIRMGVSYGFGGVLTPEQRSLQTESPDELRSILKPRQEQSIAAQLVALAPRSRTSISSSYQWGSRTAVTPPDLFNVTDTRSLPGLNVAVRQPIPQPTYMPGRLEATAEFRNMLADGYVPIRTADGRQLYLIEAARSFRGGLNFVF